MQLLIFLHTILIFFCSGVQHITWYPVRVLPMPANTPQNLLPGVVQRLIQKPFTEGSFWVASLFWGSEKRNSPVIWCQLISVPVDFSAREHSWAHVHALFVSVSLCFGCVWLRCLQLIKLLGLGREVNFSPAQICFYSPL